MDVENSYYENPISLGDGVWWVGSVLPNDQFQCHVYLIENENESILIDPGSKLTWNRTREKILQITPLENIKYIIAHHQDPDITSCIEDILEEIGGNGRYLVTHWRSATLLKHYGWKIGFYEVDRNDWKLTAGKRRLKFLFTPYLHFPGNICTFDERSTILFTSDIFGAFTEKFSLFVEDPKSYFEQMKMFHTHYMPSKEILNHGLDAIERCDARMIAPQHGSIIKKEHIGYLISRLRRLDVGIFLHFSGYRDIRRLVLANEIMSKMFEIVSFATASQYDKIGSILILINQLFQIERIVCLSSIEGKVIMFDSLIQTPKEIKMDENELYTLIERTIKKEGENRYIESIEEIDLGKRYLAYPFVTYNEHKSAIGVCYFLFNTEEYLDEEDREILKNFKKIFAIMLMKEIAHYKTQKEKNELLSRVITDSLTGLYNRHYLEEIANKELHKSKRHGYPLSVVMLDLDRFKEINDRYGHGAGDAVLKDFAQILKSNLRESDFLFRYGGEEFLIIMPFTSSKEAKKVLERLKLKISQKESLIIAGERISYTFSAGIAELKDQQSIYELIAQSDEKLYMAKRYGRDAIVI